MPSGWQTGAVAATPGSGSQTFTASGTFVVPSGVTRLRVLQWGAGGGGLTGYFGGGSGGFAMSLFPVLPGQSASITVGAAGVGGSSPTAGGATTVAVGSNSVTVGGGGPGTTSAAGSAGNAPTTNTNGMPFASWTGVGGFVGTSDGAAAFPFNGSDADGAPNTTMTAWAVSATPLGGSWSAGNGNAPGGGGALGYNGAAGQVTISW